MRGALKAKSARSAAHQAQPIRPSVTGWQLNLSLIIILYSLFTFSQLSPKCKQSLLFESPGVCSWMLGRWTPSQCPTSVDGRALGGKRKGTQAYIFSLPKTEEGRRRAALIVLRDLAIERKSRKRKLSNDWRMRTAFSHRSVKTGLEGKKKIPPPR